MQQSVFIVLYETLFETNFRTRRPEPASLTLAPMARGLLPPLLRVKTPSANILAARWS